MKLFISKIAFALSMIVIFSCVSFAQKEDYVWQLGNVALNFNNIHDPIDSGIKLTSHLNLSCISDSCGRFLFAYSANQLFGSAGAVVNKNVGSVLMSPSLVPYPGHPDKSLFFYKADGDTGLVCCALDNKTSKKEVVKIFGYGISPYTFVQQGFTDNIWMIARRDDNVDLTLITKNGFLNTNTYSGYPSFTGSIIVNHSNDIIVLDSKNNVNVAMSFDNNSGILLGEVFRISHSSMFRGAFSLHDSFFYYVAPIEEGAGVFRIDVGGGKYNTPELVSILDEGGFVDLKCGPDGCIYLCCGGLSVLSYKKLCVITDAESVSPKIQVLLPDGVRFLPFTFHYRRGFTADIDCDAVNFECNYPSAVKWNWDLGDGSTFDLQSFVYVYDSPGTYEVTLSVVTGEGEELEFRQNVTIAASPQTPIIIAE